MKTFCRRPFLVGEISFNYYDLANRENLPYFDVAKSVLLGSACLFVIIFPSKLMYFVSVSDTIFI